MSSPSACRRPTSTASRSGTRVAMSAPAAVDFPGLLSGLAEHAERPALSFYRGKVLEGRLCYAELVERVEALAGGLSERLGVRPGARVALLAPNRLEVPVLVLALLRLGAVVVPLNPAAAPEDWEYILRHSGARGVCGTRELLLKVPRPDDVAFTLALEEAFALTGRAPEPPSGLAEETAVILYTSGTT